MAAQIELSLKGDRHSVFRDRTSLPPGYHLALFRWLFPEDDLKQGSGAPPLFEFLFVLAQLQEQASDQAGALSSYRRLLSEFKKENYDSSGQPRSRRLPTRRSNGFRADARAIRSYGQCAEAKRTLRRQLIQEGRGVNPTVALHSARI